MRQRLLVSVAGELTNRLLECFEEDSRGNKHIAVHWFTYAYPKKSFPTSLCGVLVFGSVPGRRLRPPSLSHTALSHTQSLSHTHTTLSLTIFVTHTTLSHTIFPTHLCHTHFFTLDKNWIITVIRRELNPITCNWTRINERFSLGFSA